MIKLPYVKYSGEPFRKYTAAFGGLDLRDGAAEGTLTQTLNIDTSRFPYLASRRAKYSGQTLFDLSSGRGVHSVWGDGETLAFFEAEVGGIGDRVTFKSRNESIPDLNAVWKWNDGNFDEAVRCGGNLVVFTDPTASSEDGNLSPQCFENGVWKSLGCAVTGTAVFSGDSVTLSGYSVSGGLYGTADFNVGDALTISGCKTLAENNMTLVLSAVSTVSDGITLTFDGAAFGEGAESGVEVARRVPENLEFPVASANRIWGVSGTDICACALGDPLNWELFEGTAADAYRVSSGSTLPFTASGVYGSTPVFFTENSLYRIYGTLPSNFTLKKTDVSGVASGCAKSVCKINETLYYKGRNGVYAYSGGVPVCVSDALGDLSQYTDAVAGEDGRRYYVSLRKGKEYSLFVYDTETGIWLKEDDTGAFAFAKYGGVMYYLGHDMKLHSYEPDPEGELVSEESEPFRWKLVFSPITETVEKRKVYSRITLRAELGAGAYACLYIRRDGGVREQLGTLKSLGGGTVSFPIRVKKCDSFVLEAEGEGQMCLKTLVREYRTAGER